MLTHKGQMRPPQLHRLSLSFSPGLVCNSVLCVPLCPSVPRTTERHSHHRGRHRVSGFNRHRVADAHQVIDLREGREGGQEV